MLSLRHGRGMYPIIDILVSKSSKWYMAAVDQPVTIRALRLRVGTQRGRHARTHGRADVRRRAGSLRLRALSGRGLHRLALGLDSPRAPGPADRRRSRRS